MVPKSRIKQAEKANGDETPNFLKVIKASGINKHPNSELSDLNATMGNLPALYDWPIDVNGKEPSYPMMTAIP